VHVFPYSARSGTAAARMSGQIPEAERRRRSRVLNDLDRKVGQAVRAGFVGQVRPVLWENAEPAQAAGPGQVTWAGLTDNYLRVLTTAPAGLDLHNQITPVRLVGQDNENLWGER
jgi:threonylcarbamoyladenosine tRNA methylthiotransferase MtaB